MILCNSRLRSLDSRVRGNDRNVQAKHVVPVYYTAPFVIPAYLLVAPAYLFLIAANLFIISMNLIIITANSFIVSTRSFIVSTRSFVIPAQLYVIPANAGIHALMPAQKHKGRKILGVSGI